MKRIFTFILGLCLLASCSGNLTDTGSDSFVLRSRDMGMETKAGVPFTENTSYWFFAFNRSVADGTTEFDYPAVIQCAGTESGEGIISFPDGTRSHFGGRSMDFYGLTFADTDASHWSDGFTTTSGQSPKYGLQRGSDGNLGDLRLGVLRNVSSENSTGRLEVDFQHALSKLHFVAARQDVANLEGIYVSSIEVYDYDAARLDLENGTWTAEGDTTKRTVYSYQPAVAAAPAPEKMLTSSSSLVSECLVFPRASGPKPLRVVVKTYNPTSGDAIQDNNSQTLRQEFDIPVDLERNHEYTLSITITNKGVRIIILTPQEAEWIPTDPVGIDLGQPVTFGGITWADRNIGATFAPANNKLENITNIRDWDNMRGYFYQFGRNVPYFFLKNRKIGSSTTLYKDFENNDYTYCISSKDRTNAPYALLDGNSIASAYDAAVKNKSWSDVVTGGGVMPLAFTATKRDVYGSVNYVNVSDYNGDPADAKRFAVVTGNASDTDPWWKIDNARPDKGTPHTWDEVRNQPCPKGWRIPTRDDWAYIMPLNKRTGDITFHPGDPSVSNTKTGKYSYKDKDGVEHVIDDFKYTALDNREFNNHYRHLKVEGGLAWWAETGGDRYDVKINGALSMPFAESLGDPVAGYTTQYLCVSPEKNLTRGTLYAIKCVGTPAAYRLKWEFVIHDDMPPVGARNSQNIYPVTMRISRYVSNASETLENLQDLNELDWEHPAEVMELPDCGYLFTQEKPVLVNAGNETIYACSTIDPSDGWYYAVRLKYNNFTDGASLGSRYLMLIKMRRAYGMCIRPVRDNSVIID